MNKLEILELLDNLGSPDNKIKLDIPELEPHDNIIKHAILTPGNYQSWLRDLILMALPMTSSQLH